MPNRRKNAPPGLLTRRWRTALANAGLKQAEWAASNNWTDAHVSQVVAGRRESRRVMEAVLAFIAQQEQAIAARAGQPAA